jgi:hypothetical protein
MPSAGNLKIAFSLDSVDDYSFKAFITPSDPIGDH